MTPKQRKLLIANGSFLEAQFQSFDDQVSNCRKGATAASFCIASAADSRRRWGIRNLVSARGHHGKDRLASCSVVMLG